MSLPSEAPFVLGSDAILDLPLVFEQLRKLNYVTAPEDDTDTTPHRLRLEIHIPLPLLAHACDWSSAGITHGDLQKSHDFIERFLSDNRLKRSADDNGNMHFRLTDPYVTVVLDNSSEVVHNPSVYGPALVSTQLLTDAADCLRKRLTRNEGHYANAINKRQEITLVTSNQASAIIGLACGYQIWDYSEPLSEYLLMDLGLVKIQDGKPVLCNDAPIAEEAPGWAMPD